MACDIFKFFKNACYYYIAYNNTSRTPIFYKPYYQIIHIGEETMTLRLPLKSCALNHSLSFIMSENIKDISVSQIPSTLDIQNTVHVTSKITSLEEKEHFVEIQVKLTNYKTDDWETIQSFFNKKQKQVSKILNRMKGYNS